MMKERVINIRFLLCVFIGLIFGIIISKLFLFNFINLIILILILICVIVCTISLIIYSYKIKNYNLTIKSRKNVSFLINYSSIGFCCAIIVGFILALFPLIDMMKINTYNEEVVVSGIVCDYVDYETTYKKFLIKDCFIVSDSSSKTSQYKIMVYSSSYSNVSLGDRITFVSSIDKYDLKDFGFSQLCNKIAYSTYVTSSDMIVENGDMSLKDDIHENVRKLLYGRMSQDNAEICYAILFGQKHGLTDSISQMFSYAGISHILAVSGLHIGVLVSCIWFCLNKIKANKYVKLVFFSIILLFYCYLCSFSPSVCRASLMAFTLAICRSFFIEYDIISSLSLSGIIILFISPMSLFSISFQLSFMCIFAIITFAPTLKDLFAYIKLPKVLCESLSISIAVNIAIIPICMNSFAEVSLLGVIANIFVLPIFSLTYILLFIVILLTLIFKFLSFLLFLPNIFLHLIKVIAQYVSQIGFGILKVFNISYWLILLFAVVFLSLHCLMIKSWIKFTWSGFVSLFIIVLFIVYSIPNTYNSNTLIIAEQYNSNVVIYVKDEKVTLIGSNISKSNLITIMKEVKLKNIDNIIAYDLQLNKIDNLCDICVNFNIKSVMIPNEFESNGISKKINNTLFFDASQSVGGFSFIQKDEEVVGVIGDFEEIGSVIIPNIENNKSQNLFIINNFLDSDYIIIDDNKIWKDIDCDGQLIDVTSCGLNIWG